MHDVPVLTEWSVDAIRAELEAPQPVFYILANSRSLPACQAQQLALELGRNLTEASHGAAVKWLSPAVAILLCRGHFPIEVEALATGLGTSFDAWLILPCFFEGGRYTLDDIHYVAEGEWLVPAAETESARDATFGYHASNLRQWVEEKTAGRVPASASAASRSRGSGRLDPSRSMARCGLFRAAVSASSMRPSIRTSAFSWQDS